MPDLSIFKLDSETITIKDTTARQAAESAKTLATTASGNATTALNKINELESEKADTIISSTSGAIASLPDGAESTAKKLVVGIEPVQEGTGDPSPDNVRPISGWNGVKVTRTRKNLYPGTDINAQWATFMPDMLTAIKEIPIGTKFTISFDVRLLSKESTFSSASQYGMAFIGYTTPNKSKKINWNASDGIGTVRHFDITLVAQDGLRTVYCYGCGEDTNGVTGLARIFNIQLELGSTVTDYEPYQGETYDITFPSEAGTVYGGTLDVTTGVLTVDRAQIASYAGETLPSTWISDRDVYSAGATPTTGAQVVYELATPQTYQLTPTEIRILLGQNNIWADTGDMSVTYRADTKLYIDNKFTELQALILENLEGETDHD